MRNLFERVIQEYSRKREDTINNQILTSEPKKNESISKLIDDTLQSGHTVWVMTDCHFIRYDKSTKKISPIENVDKIIEKCREKIHHDDLLIYLGDLCDGEVEQKETLSHYINSIPGIKILVRGNNDLFPDKWYLTHGFKYVVPKFIWNDILFSHRPQDNDCRFNIHGHIHSSKGHVRYYASEIMKYRNQMDAAYFGARETPIELKWLIDQFDTYKSDVNYVNHPWKDDPIVSTVLHEKDGGA